MRTEKKVETGEKQGIMVTQKTIIHGTDKDPRLLGKVGVASALANEDNVDKIMNNLEQLRRRLFK